MDQGWKETFWKIIQNEMDSFVQELADNQQELDEYEEFNQTLLDRRIRALERLGERPDDALGRRNRIHNKYIRRADILTDIRAVEYLRLYERNCNKRYRVSKGFRKAYNICPRDLGKEITKAPREVIDTLNKRADLIFTKLDKMYPTAYTIIDHDSELILETWLEGKEYDEDEVKTAEAQVGVFYDSLKFIPWDTLDEDKDEDDDDDDEN